MEGTPEAAGAEKDPHRAGRRGPVPAARAEHASPVDTDLLSDITSLPERQRLTIILNELGAGFAGPRQRTCTKSSSAPTRRCRNSTRCCTSSPTRTTCSPTSPKNATGRWRRSPPVRKKVADFIDQSNTVAKASALHRSAIGKNFEDFPAFLEAFGPPMERLGKLAEQTTPTFRDLEVAAPGIDKTFENLGPFSESSDKFFKSFGQTAKVSGPGAEGLRTAAGRRGKARQSAPSRSRATLAGLLSSLRETGGLERIMDFIFVGTGASNGYDALGHFLRAEVRGQRLRELLRSLLRRAAAPNSSTSKRRLESDLRPSQRAEPDASKTPAW